MSLLCRAHFRWSVALALVVSVGIALAAGGSPPARAAGNLQQQIDHSRSAAAALSGSVQSAASRVASLNSDVAAVEHRLSIAQAHFDAERATLLRLRVAQTAARARLAVLEAAQQRDEATLSQQLLAAYESDRPDLVTVVLEARGFNDLLERLSFAARVRHQTTTIVDHVRTARRAVAAQAVRLGALEVRQQAVTARVYAERNLLARDGAALQSRLAAAARRRDATAAALAAERGRVASLEHRLAQLRAAQAAAAARAAAAAAPPSSNGASAASPTSSPPSSGAAPAGSSGGFTFPLPKGAASPPGTWSLDQGVDISAPGGTPEFAVCSGTIVLHGIGGFGPWAPVLHCDSSLGGYSYVYYGHAGPANQLPVGTHVSAGETMSEVGPGIVGISTGPHIEIGFADGSGNPVGGGSASTMMSLLRGSY